MGDEGVTVEVGVDVGDGLVDDGELDGDGEGDVLDCTVGWLPLMAGWLAPLPLWRPVTTTIVDARRGPICIHTRAVPGPTPRTSPDRLTVSTADLELHHTAPARSAGGASLPSASRR